MARSSPGSGADSLLLGPTGRDNPRVVETPELLVDDAAGWRSWLAANHTTSQGVRLVLAKKNVSGPTVLTHDDALREALSDGWIDGQLMRRDDATYSVRFTPRRARSPWSLRNVELADRLVADGLMRPAGLVQIQLAKEDGRWERAYRGSATIEVPDDLRDALAASPRSQATWERLTRTNRYSVLYRVLEAKRPETRARRIASYVEMLARGETPHPQRAKP